MFLKNASKMLNLFLSVFICFASPVSVASVASVAFAHQIEPSLSQPDKSSYVTSIMPPKISKRGNANSYSSTIETLESGEKVRKVIKPANLPSLEGKIGDWYILKIKPEDGREYCYMVAYPFDHVGNQSDKADSYIMIVAVTKKRQDVLVHSGFQFRGHSDVMIGADNKQFTFLGNESFARSKNIMDDKKLISAMIHSYSLVVKSDSDIGTYSVDTYMLFGFSEAYLKMVNSCHYAH